jgi:signal transduction histidine kinase
MTPQLAAIVVHDLKNALGVLESELAALSEQPERSRASHAHANCVALREKLIGFLTLYKASEQGLSARIEDVSPADFLHELIRHHETARPELNVRIRADNLPDVAFFDEYLVGLALDAALQNAIRFAKREIVIGCRKDGEQTVFTILDDGDGLGSAEAQPSTGLGMALCAAIAEAHRHHGQSGSVSLENAGNGGALFTMRL